MEKVIVFGAGNCGRLIGSALYHEGKEIVCFIDNDPLKEGKNVILDTTLSREVEYLFIPLPELQL